MPGRRRLVRGLPPKRGSALIDLSSSSESLLRRNPQRNARPRDGSLTDPLDKPDDAEEQQNLESSSVHLKVQHHDVTTKHFEKASFRSAISSKSEMSSGRSNSPSASIKSSNSTRIPDKAETYTDLPPNLHRRTEPQANQFDSSALLASDEESELETTLPHGLATSIDLSKKVYTSQVLPSTAPSKAAPVVQVKQTPDVNGRPNGGLDRLALPSKPTDRSLADQPDRSISLIAHLETRNLDTLSAKRKHGHVNGKRTVAPSSERYGCSPVQSATEHQTPIEVSSSIPTADHAFSSIEETVLPVRPPEEAQVPSTYVNGSPRSFAVNPLNLKRNSEPLHTSPNITKRLKAPLTRAATSVGHASSPWQDPAVGGRQQRSAYLKSIRPGDLANFKRHHRCNDPGGPCPKSPHQEEEIYSPASPAVVTEAVEESELQAAKDFPVLPSPRKDVVAGSIGRKAAQVASNCSPIGSPKPVSINTFSQAVQEKTQSAPHTDFQNSLLNSAVHPLESDDVSIEAPSPSESRLQHQTTASERRFPKTTLHDVDKEVTSEVSNQDLMVGAVEISQALPTQHVIDDQGESANVAPGHAPAITAPEMMNIAEELSRLREANHADAEESMRLSNTMDVVDLKHLNKEPVQHHHEDLSLQRAEASPREQLETQVSREDRSLFTRFKTEYPDYTGNASHFEKICSKIESLARVDRMEHPSLWDDFVIRHKTDYPQYTSQCMEDALDPVPYERFYRTAIEEPKYTKRLVTPKTLYEVVPQSPSVSELGHMSVGYNFASRGLDQPRNSSVGAQVMQAWANMPNRTHEWRSVSSQDRNHQSPKSRTPPVLTSNDRLVRKRKQSPDAVPGANDSPSAQIKHEIVDLTEDDHENGIAEPAKSISPPAPSAKRVRRSLPWAASVEGESSTKISKASPLKTVPLSSPIPAPMRQPRSFPSQSLQKEQRPSEAPQKPPLKAPINTPSPSMPPPTFKNPLTRYNTAKPPTTPPTSTIKSPQAPHPQSNSTPRQTQLSGYWVRGRDEDEKAPYPKFEHAYKAIRPGRWNSFAPLAKDAGDQATPMGKVGKGWKHDPFKLFL